MGNSAFLEFTRLANITVSDVTDEDYTRSRRRPGRPRKSEQMEKLECDGCGASFGSMLIDGSPCPYCGSTYTSGR